ncbi:MAG: ABC transporter permease [Acidobacteriota bacterium]|nr:ABC transporter permease [Acidobacteriota bacterium]
MSWIRRLIARRRIYGELSEEIRAHLEEKIEELVAGGMPRVEAEHAARREFGNLLLTEQRGREVWRWSAFENLWLDVRYALRMLRKSPGFAAVAILTLALGIGANAAIFSVLESALLRPLPYPHAERLVLFGILVPAIDSRPALFSSAYVKLRDERSPFESMASWRPGVRSCDLAESRPVRLACAQAESTFLPTFGVQPILGRNFDAAEDRAGAPSVCLISYGLWQRRFGGDPAALNQTLSLDGKTARIIGILPRDFEWPTLARVDVILPEALTADERSMPMAGFVRAYARLKPGVSLDEARAQLAPVFEGWRQEAPPFLREDMRLGLISVRDDQVGSVRRALWVLFAAALALLLLATANVANLLLARGAVREREFAVRAALGAGRWGLIRLRLVESALLGLAGGIVGTGLALLLLRLFVALAPAGIPRIGQAGLGTPVVLFILAASLVSGLLCGMAPAAAAPSATALAAGRSLGPPRRRFGAALVVAQVAVSLVLIADAGLFLDTLRNLQNIPLGMATSNVVTAQITLGRQGYSTPGAASEFFDRLETRLSGLAGVTAVAVSDSLPPTGGERAQPFAGIRVEGRPPLEKGKGGMVGWRMVTPGYFRLLGIPILAGRGFLAADRGGQTNAIILSKTLAARLFPGENPIGGHLQLASPKGPWFDVVGVAGDVNYVTVSGRVEAAGPEYYVVRKYAADMAAGAPADGSGRESFFLVQSPLPAPTLETLVRSGIASLDPTLPAAISTLKARVDRLRVQPRFNAALISLFAGLGLLLSALGLYGLLSFLVAQRTQEIGVRMALGAVPRNLLRMVVWRGVRMVLAGLAAGLAMALAAARLLHGLLYGVSPENPAVLATAAMLLLFATFAASYFPARRAMRVDPATALRHE